MPGEYPTIYQMARKESHYTQGQAAERLFVSEKTIKAWEQGQRVPGNVIVARMADLYGTPWILLERAFETLYELGILPGGIHAQSLQPAVLSYLDLLNQQLDGCRRLIQITADGQIDNTEQADFDTITSVILQNVVVGLQISIYQKLCIKKDRSAAATTERSGSERYNAANDHKSIIAQRGEYSQGPIFAGREVLSW